MIWLGKETTWICLGNNHILAYLILPPLDSWKLSQPFVKNMHLFINLFCQKHVWKLSRLVRNVYGFMFKNVDVTAETLASGLAAFFDLAVSTHLLTWKSAHIHAIQTYYSNACDMYSVAQTNSHVSVFCRNVKCHILSWPLGWYCWDQVTNIWVNYLLRTAACCGS